MSVIDGKGAAITEFVGIAGTGEIIGKATVTACPSVVCKWVKFKAQASNPTIASVGISASLTLPAGTTDATSGFPLSAGEETDWLPVNSGNLSSFYYICTAVTDHLSYMALS